MSIQLYPLTFYPIYKEKIWGGRKLQELFDRQLPAGLIGESWDVAAHSNGTSVVVDGPLAGKNLGELVSSYGRDLVDVDTFPLLVKLIDAQQDLSVQVHPDDVYVKNHTNERWGKDRMVVRYLRRSGGLDHLGFEAWCNQTAVCQSRGGGGRRDSGLFEQSTG